MGIISNNSPYKDVPEDLFFSFPVTISEGKWRIVKGLKFSAKMKSLMGNTVKELLN